MPECLRCPELGRKRPNETKKMISGVPVCSECMLADAAKNRGIVKDYSYLKPQPAEREMYVKDAAAKPKTVRK